MVNTAEQAILQDEGVDAPRGGRREGTPTEEARAPPDEEIIRKTPEMLGSPPNLPDYDAALPDFSWERAKSEAVWMPGGKINAAQSIDRHAQTWRKNKVALYFEPDDGKTQKYTFLELSEESNRAANMLVRLGLENGDRVFIFLSRCPELYFSFLGAIKAGATASILFPAFGPEAVRDRLADSEAKFLVIDTPLYERVKEIFEELPHLKTIIRTDKTDVSGKEASYHAEVAKSSRKFDPVPMDPEDGLFMLYTSGTTGLPKGIFHVHAGIVQQTLTTRWVLDVQDHDIYWCTADPGWVTGISYGILGPWSLGASTVSFGGRFDAARWYGIVEKYRVTNWYTAPTAIRMLMAAGNELPKRFDLSSLRILYSVGEPLNPECVRWSMEVFNKPFHDNWWQTETGSILITNFPCLPIKPGSMGKPFPGIVAGIVDENWQEVPPGREGNLAIRPGWPSMMRAVWKNERRYQDFFKNGWYITGDTARVDSDGYFWFVGRSDDVIKTSGERVGPFEVESTLVEHPAVAEAGVIGKPDELRGAIIKAFVTLRPGHTPSEELKKDIQNFVKKRLAAHAYPREIEFRSSLPKTRSGKIMRRLLKAQELGLPIGDVSTLED